MNVKITIIFHVHKNFDNKLISKSFEEPLKRYAGWSEFCKIRLLHLTSRVADVPPRQTSLSSGERGEASAVRRLLTSIISCPNIVNIHKTHYNWGIRINKNNLLFKQTWLFKCFCDVSNITHIQKIFQIGIWQHITR